MKGLLLLLAPIIICLSPPPGATQASPYIPLDHWSMPYIEHLIRAGVLADPDPMTRPFRRRAVAAALDSARLADRSASTVALVQSLRTEFDPGTATNGGFEIAAGGGARSHARRYDLFPAGEGGLVGRAGYRLWGGRGPLTLSSGALIYTNIFRDPDYKGIREHGGRSQISGRTRDAYASLEASFGEIVFGNLDRNWGPPGFQGLLFSDASYSFDHLLIRMKTRFVSVETSVSQLEDIELEGENYQRYWILHRATAHLSKRFELWLNQGTLLTGRNRQLEPWALNPLRLNDFSAFDEDRNEGTNRYIEGAVWLRLGTTTFSGSLLIDDISLTLRPALSRAAATLVADGPLGTRGSWSAGYTFVSNLTYRTVSPVEITTRRGVGLGRNFSDYDQLTLRTSYLAPRNTIVGGEITLLRRGEGDIRDPFPAESEFPSVVFLHEGVVERTLRLAFSIVARPTNGLTVNGQAGIHLTGNTNHVAGTSSTLFVGGFEVKKYLAAMF